MEYKNCVIQHSLWIHKKNYIIMQSDLDLQEVRRSILILSQIIAVKLNRLRFFLLLNTLFIYVKAVKGEKNKLAESFPR